jgi:ADP-ribosylglycohydrolase
MTLDIDPLRLRAAWSGRISGCLLGKPVEVLSYREGPSGLARYLEAALALPLEDYVPALAGTEISNRWLACCRDHIERFEPDDDINYTVLALLLLEKHGTSFTVADVARQWLSLLPAGATWTAERAAYATLLARMDSEFVNGAPAGFDLDDCSSNACNDWIGAQIRADLYGWVCPGEPELAAKLATRDGSLSHRGEGLHGAAFVAAWASAIPAADSVDSAIDVALDCVPANSATAAAVRFGRHAAARGSDATCIHDEYAGLSPVHTLNNLAIVVWSLCRSARSFDRAIGECVLAGLDTDSNAATVGGLAGIAGFSIADRWTQPWNGRVGVDLAGYSELDLDDLVLRTVAVSRQIASRRTA